jgi:hypothetical protein
LQFGKVTLAFLPNNLSFLRGSRLLSYPQIPVTESPS